MRPALMFAAAVILTACSGETASSQTPRQAPPTTAPATGAGIATDPGGSYRRTEPSSGDLVIAREGEEWRLSVVAGGVQAGAGTAADCELEAVGPMVGDQIVGRLAAFEGQMGGLTAAEIGETPGTITVTITDDGSAVVSEEAASSRHCGLGSDLSGTYSRAG